MKRAVGVALVAAAMLLQLDVSVAGATSGSGSAASEPNVSRPEGSAVLASNATLDYVMDAAGSSDGTLSNGVPVTGISGASGSQAFWQLQVPSGQASLRFTISGGTGDADLYVQLGAKPTLSSYLCRPYLNGNSETCTFTPPQAGTYWVMLNGYASYSGVTLTGTYSASGGGGGDPYLTNGVAVSNLSGTIGSARYWRINTPAGKTLTVKISGGSGDADLYTRFGSRPTASRYSCRPHLVGNNETCILANTSAGDYYVMVRGYEAYSGITLIASY